MKPVTFRINKEQEEFLKEHFKNVSKGLRYIIKKEMNIYSNKRNFFKQSPHSLNKCSLKTCSDSVVRSIISASRAEHPGSNPGRSITFS